MTSVEIRLPGSRTDTNDFFALSGYYHEARQWKHCPLLAFEGLKDQVVIHILTSQAQLRQSGLPDDTPCMQQWRGEWRSDFFTFTLGKARAALS